MLIAAKPTIFHYGSNEDQYNAKPGDPDDWKTSAEYYNISKTYAEY